MSGQDWDTPARPGATTWPSGGGGVPNKPADFAPPTRAGPTSVGLTPVMPALRQPPLILPPGQMPTDRWAAGMLLAIQAVQRLHAAFDGKFIRSANNP